MVGLLLRLLMLPVRLVTLPFKVVGAVSTFMTCAVPIIVLLAIAAGVGWFLFIR